MVDTYGARLDEVRAFIEDGWAAMANNEGSLSGNGELFRLSHTDFEKFAELFDHFFALMGFSAKSCRS